MRFPNGFGSIFKLSGNRRRPYAVQVCLGWTNEGKPIRKYLGYYKTRQEALKALSDYNSDPYDLNNKNITLQEVWEKLVSYRKERGKPIHHRYISAFNYLKPLYSCPFISINANQYQNIIDIVSDRPSAASAIKTTVGHIYKHARFLNITDKDLSTTLEVPTIPKSTLHKPFTDEELAELWENKEELGAKLALILCYTGMRPSELLLIKNENVHLDEKYIVGGIKTKAGKNREIPISDKILPLVKSLYSDKEYLVMRDDQPVLYDYFRKFIWKRSNAICLQSHTPHDGRHTCETRLDNAHVNKRIIQLIIGHAGDVDATYTHKTREQILEAINKI